MLFPGGSLAALLGDVLGPGAEGLPSIGTIISVFGIHGAVVHGSALACAWPGPTPILAGSAGYSENA